MPYFRDPNLEDQSANPTQGGAGNVQLSSGGVQTGQGGSPQPGQGASATKSGSNFTNIDQYLQNNNAKQFGQEFGGKIQSDITGAKQNMDTTAGNVENQINSSGSIPSATDISGAISKAGTGTTPEDAKQYQSWINNSYSGPNSLADNQSAWSQYWGQTQKAQQEAKQAGSEPGRFALLDQYYGRPNYSFGQKSLDNLLVQGGGGLDQAGLQNQAQGLSAQGQQQSQDIQQAATKRSTDIANSAQAAKSAIGLQDNGTIGTGGAIGNLETDINNRTTAADQAYQDKYNALERQLSGTTLDPQALAATGLQNGQETFGLNLKDYLKPQGPAPTTQQVANPQDYAKYLALTQLAGVDPTFLTAAQQSQAGSTPEAPNFDLTAFHTALQGPQNAYNSALTQQVKELPNTPYKYSDLPDLIKKTQAAGFGQLAQQYQGILDSFNKQYNYTTPINQSGTRGAQIDNQGAVSTQNPVGANLPFPAPATATLPQGESTHGSPGTAQAPPWQLINKLPPTTIPNRGGIVVR